MKSINLMKVEVALQRLIGSTLKLKQPNRCNSGGIFPGFFGKFYLPIATFLIDFAENYSTTQFIKNGLNSWQRILILIVM